MLFSACITCDYCFSAVAGSNHGVTASCPPARIGSQGKRLGGCCGRVHPREDGIASPQTGKNKEGLYGVSGRHACEPRPLALTAAAAAAAALCCSVVGIAWPAREGDDLSDVVQPCRSHTAEGVPAGRSAHVRHEEQRQGELCEESRAALMGLPPAGCSPVANRISRSKPSPKPEDSRGRGGAAAYGCRVRKAQRLGMHVH